MRVWRARKPDCRRQVPSAEQAGSGRDGFTLLESLLAFAMLALVLTVVFASLSRLMLADRRADLTRRALQMAQSKLNEFGITQALTPGTARGELEEGFHWDATVRPMANDSKGRLQGFWVEVRVSTPQSSGQSAASVTLTTLKLARGAS